MIKHIALTLVVATTALGGLAPSLDSGRLAVTGLQEQVAATETGGQATVDGVVQDTFKWLCDRMNFLCR